MSDNHIDDDTYEDDDPYVCDVYGHDFDEDGYCFDCGLHIEDTQDV